jgi:hypothetical protein
LAEAELTQGEAGATETLDRLLARDIIEPVAGGVRFEVELTRRWWELYG